MAAPPKRSGTVDSSRRLASRSFRSSIPHSKKAAKPAGKTFPRDRPAGPGSPRGRIRRCASKGGDRAVSAAAGFDGRATATMDGARRGKGGDGVIDKNGRRLTTLADWHSHAPPKSEGHWKDGRSAKESARFWLGAAPDLPSGIANLLRATGSVGALRSWSAEPEARVSFDAFSGPANLDVLVRAQDEAGPVVIGIEAKADETFGKTVERTLQAAGKELERNPRSKRVQRIRGLAATFGLDLDRPGIPGLRHQLLTLTAATVAEARRQSADRAVVIVHELVSDLVNAGCRARNARDLDRFLEAAFGHPDPLRPGTVAGPFRMGGLRALHFGKTETAVQGRAAGRKTRLTGDRSCHLPPRGRSG